MPMKKRETTYTAVYEPAGEPGWWTVRIDGVPGAVSQGRSIAQSRDRVREALALVLDVDHVRLHIVDDVRLPTALQRKVDRYRKRRDAAEAEARAASEASRDAVRAVLAAGFSTRDAGEALGISQSRVAQLGS